MGFTTPDNIPFPDPGSTLTPLETHFAAVAQGAQDAISALRGSTTPPAASEAQRNAIYPTPVQGNAVFRTDRGYVERYYSEYSSGGNPGGRTPADWYPDGTATLPDPIRSMGITGGSTIITATAWAVIPSLSPITLVLPAPAWVDLRLGSWLGASTGNVRAGISVSGATTITEDESGQWGNVMYAQDLNGPASGAWIGKARLLNAGTNIITARAYKAATGTCVANYPILEAFPLRWA